MDIMESRRWKIKVLTPVHIGCGEVYEPFSFAIKDNKLLVFDMEQLLSALDEKTRREFSNICLMGTSDAIIKMYKFVRRNVAERKDIIEKGIVKKTIDVTRALVEHYNSQIIGTNQPAQRSYQSQQNRPFNNSSRVISQFQIYRTFFDPNSELPIIPGSSVKGAIRTAVLNARKNEVANKTLRNYYYKDRFGKINYDAKKLESDILKYKKFQEDPFSLVRVSDFRPVGQPKVKVTYAINVKKSSGKPGRGPYQIVEALLEGEFEGTITILKYQKSSERRIDSPLSFEEIKGALKGFYGKELEREKKEMEKTGISYKAIQQPTIPIRIGRHSGAECVTIEGFRVIRIMGSNTPGATPTTLWLASEDRSKPQNAMPFGWCSVIEE